MTPIESQNLWINIECMIVIQIYMYDDSDHIKRHLKPETYLSSSIFPSLIR